MKTAIVILLCLIAVSASADSVVVITSWYQAQSLSSHLDDNWLQEGSISHPANGAKDTMRVGHVYDGEFGNLRSRIVIEPNRKTARDSIKMADSAISCICSTKVKSQSGIGTDDSLVLTVLIKNFSEATSTFQICTTGTNWTGLGAGSDRNDYINVVISKIPVPANGAWAIFDCKPALDSVVAFRWPIEGFRMALNDESSESTEWVTFRATEDGDNANRPLLKYVYAYKILLAGQRHGQGSRHGQPTRSGG